MHQVIAADTARAKLTNAGAHRMTARDPIDAAKARTMFRSGVDGGTSRLSVERP
jgi:hypothetical protein